MSITTAGASLVNIGRVTDPKHCKNVADYFGRPFYVTLPVNSNVPHPTEHMCFVGGLRSKVPSYEPSFMQLGSEANPDSKTLADNASKSNIVYSYQQSPNRQLCMTSKGEVVKCLPRLAEKQVIVAAPSTGCACDHPIGYLTLVSPLPYTERKENAVIQSPPEMLKLFAAHRNQPWELRKRFSYTTKLNDISIPVFKGTFDCLKVGCEELFTGDIVEIQNVLGYKTIQYKVNMYS